MKLASLFTTAETRPADTRQADPRPRDDELDLYGITHPGRVRPDNQDQFLLCTIHPQVVVHGTSLPEPENLAVRGGSASARSSLSPTAWVEARLGVAPAGSPSRP